MVVKLPVCREITPPAAFHVNGKDVPEWSNDDRSLRVRVLVGSYKDKTASFVVGNEELTYLDVQLTTEAGCKIFRSSERDCLHLHH